MTDYDVRIVSRLVDALTWEMSNEDVVQGLIDHLGVDEVLGAITFSDILEYIGEEKEPEQVFTQDELEEWATNNDFVSAAEMDNYDPPGYEERERY